MTALAVVCGLIVGSLPTATLIARRQGVDLARSGSTNPGANNAWRLGGPRLGAAVLAVEISKGVAAVIAGSMIAGPSGAVAAGVAAVTGNVVNPWLRFRGGQGLGISVGVLLAASPVVLSAVLLVTATVTAATRSSHIGALSGIAGITFATAIDVAPLWGLTGTTANMLLVGLAVVLAPKQIRKLSRSRARRPSRR